MSGRIVVALSTLSVDLEPSSEAAQGSPPGFLSEFDSGWHALRTTLAGLITVASFAGPAFSSGPSSSSPSWCLWSGSTGAGAPRRIGASRP